MGYGSTLYKILLVLHILVGIIGFGTVFLAGLYGKQAADRKGREGVAITEATDFVAGQVAEWFIYAVPVFGIAMVLVSRVWNFKMLWIWLAILLYAIAITLVHAVHRPNLKKILELSRELADMGPPPADAPADAAPPPQAVELESRGKRAAIMGTTLNLFMIAVLCLMVFKPGI